MQALLQVWPHSFNVCGGVLDRENKVWMGHCLGMCKGNAGQTHSAQFPSWVQCQPGSVQ